MLHSFPFLESSILISCACSGAHLYFSSSIHNSNRNSKDQLSCYSATIRRLPVVLLRSGWGQRSAAAVNLSPVKRGEDSERRRCSKKKNRSWHAVLRCGRQVAVCGLLLRRERARNLSQSPCLEYLCVGSQKCQCSLSLCVTVRRCVKMCVCVPAL